MIVKVQISQFSSDYQTRMLVYNKSRSISYDDIATPEVIKSMNGRPKAYFKATITKDKKIQLEEMIEDQNW